MLLTRRTFKSLFLFLFLAPRSMPSVSQSVSQSVTTFAKFAWSEGNNRRIFHLHYSFADWTTNSLTFSLLDHKTSRVSGPKKTNPHAEFFDLLYQFFLGQLKNNNVKKIGQRVSKRISPSARKIPSSATESRSQISQTPSDRARAFFLLLRDSFALRTTVWLPATGGF